MVIKEGDLQASDFLEGLKVATSRWPVMVLVALFTQTRDLLEQIGEAFLCDGCSLVHPVAAATRESLDFEEGAHETSVAGQAVSTTLCAICTDRKHLEVALAKLSERFGDLDDLFKRAGELEDVREMPGQYL